MNKINLFSNLNEVNISEPYLYDMFFPISDDEFFLIDLENNDKQEVQYNHWQKVLNLVSLACDGKTKTYQTGSKDDVQIFDITRLNDSVSVNQLSFLIKRSKGVLTTNPLVLEIASRANIPLVFVANKKTIKEYFRLSPKRKNQIALENKDSLKPEQIAKEFFGLFNLKFSFDYETVYIGSQYVDGNKFIDFIPNQTVETKDLNFLSIIRMDLFFNEVALVEQLKKSRTSAIVTNKNININIIKAFKNKINKLCYIIEKENNPDFCSQVNGVGVPVYLYTELDDESILEEKIKYMEIGLINKTEEDKEGLEKLKGYDLNNLFFSSNRTLLSSGKNFPSEFHYRQNENLEYENEFIKTVNHPKFWEELQNFWILKKNI